MLATIPNIERIAGNLMSSRGTLSPDASVMIWVEMALKDMNDETE